jgi:hypothetical protein
VFTFVLQKVGDCTRERDRLVTDSLSAKQSGYTDADQVVTLLEHQARKFEVERLQYTQELQTLTSANAALRAEVEAEVRTVREVFEAVDRMRDEDEATQAKADTLKTLQEVSHPSDINPNHRSLLTISFSIFFFLQIKDNLSNVLTCSICCERYGSLSDNITRRPIHLSCGHIFCASCLHEDWSHRAAVGLEPQARCFNRCANFDVNRLAEIYLLDDVKEVLEQLPDIEMAQ